MNDFEWMGDVPGGDFCAETMDDFFEFAQVGDEIYMHGVLGTGRGLTKYDTFGKIIGISGIKIHIQSRQGTSELRFNIPTIYEKVPSLWVQEQGFNGDYEIVREIDRPYFGSDYSKITEYVLFKDVTTLLKKSRFMGDDYYNKFKIHLIDRNIVQKR